MPASDKLIAEEELIIVSADRKRPVAAAGLPVMKMRKIVAIPETNDLFKSTQVSSLRLRHINKPADRELPADFAAKMVEIASSMPISDDPALIMFHQPFLLAVKICRDSRFAQRMETDNICIESIQKLVKHDAIPCILMEGRNCIQLNGLFTIWQMLQVLIHGHYI